MVGDRDVQEHPLWSELHQAAKETDGLVGISVVRLSTPVMVPSLDEREGGGDEPRK